MIKECLVKTTILFDFQAVESLDYDLLTLSRELSAVNIDVTGLGLPQAHPITVDASAPSTPAHAPITPYAVATDCFHRPSHEMIRAKALADIVAKVWDQLDLSKSWWFLEYIPLLATYQEPNGTWIRRRM